MTSVHRVVSGPWRQNGYVVHDAKGAALVIDPGGQADAFKAVIGERGLCPLAILNTHAHYDHLGAVADLVQAFGIPFYLHSGDRALLRQANLYKTLFGETATIRVPTGFSDLASLDGALAIGNFSVAVIATPGHTKGSVCFRISDLLFSGDTLLPSGIGRVDLPGGSPVDMSASLAAIAALPRELTMYPGHGAAVLLGAAIAKTESRSGVA